ncbi:low molecular weight phosphatase family protein [Micromonospora fulviviridis]|uniref:Phosphotyrosine protein phosphatase I domain-containing protein n=1 Tax=Micromonospora fulviviridis TaxID=47860 RepID=A0ABV2VWH5_9ACTN
MTGVGRVVFVCTRNSARSQLAAALWSGRTHIAAASAGTKPATRVPPYAVAVAHRRGLALNRRPLGRRARPPWRTGAGWVERPRTLTGRAAAERAGARVGGHRRVGRTARSAAAVAPRPA